MIDLYEIKKNLEKVIIEGEIKIEDNQLYWYFNEDIEDPDFLWEVYCDNANRISKEGYETTDSWADNDSCGFDIVL